MAEASPENPRRYKNKPDPERLRAHEHLLRGGIGLFTVSGKIDRMRGELDFRNAKAAARNRGQLMAARWVDLRRQRLDQERSA